MSSLHRRTSTRFQLLATLAVSAVAACGAHPNETPEQSSSALGSCPAGQVPNAAGVCGPCTVDETASATSAAVALFFDIAGFPQASYSIVNNTGSFDISQTS